MERQIVIRLAPLDPDLIGLDAATRALGAEALGRDRASGGEIDIDRLRLDPIAIGAFHHHAPAKVEALLIPQQLAAFGSHREHLLARAQIADRILQDDPVRHGAIGQGPIGGDDEGVTLIGQPGKARIVEPHAGADLCQLRRGLGIEDRRPLAPDQEDRPDHDQRADRQQDLHPADSKRMACRSGPCAPMPVLRRGHGRQLSSMPARRQSCTCRMPTGRWSSGGMTKRQVILCSFMSFSPSCASASGEMVRGERLATSIARRSSRFGPIWRRRSPSVMTPVRLPSASMVPATPRPFWLMTTSASDMGASSATSGTRSPLAISASTVTSCAPSRPPGWNMRKRSGVKRRRSISATASASPSAMVMVVEVVGASPLAQASSASGNSSAISAARSRVEPGRPAMPIMRIANRLAWPIMSASSLVSPEFDMIRMTSWLVIMPRSPWLASPGCTNCAGVPVEASVEAIFRATWPDFPMPEQMTRPSAARIRSTASAKLSPRDCASRSSAADSTRSTRCPVSMARACSEAVGASMGKDILLRPAGKIEHCALGQEVETGFGHFQPSLPRQAPDQLVPKLMQVENVRCRIFQLRLG